MEVDKYKVEVVHFINPHLIWIEVPDKTSECEDDFYFEQVGIYGVLPLEMTMDPIEDTLKTKRCTEWMPAVTTLMKKVFVEATDIYFCPIHIDNRNSIFDDNIHKYGEIVIKKPNGKYRLLSKLLIKSGFALFNEELFLNELSSGNIKTKLSHHKIKNIIDQLEKKCQKQATKQTSVFQTAQRIESSLTVKNLQAHNKRTNSDVSAEDMLERKLRDLKMCKDVNMESLGRASKKGDPGKPESSLLLQRKLKLLKNAGGSKPTNDNFHKLNDADILNKWEKDENSNEENNDAKEVRPRESVAKYFTNGASTKNLKVRLPSDAIFNPGFSEKMPINTVELPRNAILNLGFSDKSPEKNINSPESSKNFKVEADKNVNLQVCEENVTDGWDEPRKLNKPKKHHQGKLKIPEYNIHTETRVMYGPPECNQQSLPMKIIPKDKFFETYKVETEQENQKDVPMEKGKEDIYGNVDSDCEIEENVAPKIDSKMPSNVSINTKKSAIEKPTPPKLGISEPRDTEAIATKNTPNSNSILKRKLLIYRENLSRTLNSSTTSDTSTKDSVTSVEEAKKVVKNETTLDSDDDNISEVLQKIKAEYVPMSSPAKENIIVSQAQPKSNVNPFRNVDPNISVFVDNLVTPVLMVHSKMNKRFLPVFKIRDVPFTSHIQMVLKNMSVEQPMMLQTISWFTILRGYSTFMISPKGSGKTLGYLPAVCRLISDHDSQIDGVGPTCVIVCATANLVSEVEALAKVLLGTKEGVLGIYSGMDELEMVTALLNGCDLLICTPPILARYLQSDFGVDLRRLTTFVLDDCERLSEVYGNEIKYFMHNIKEMLKTRIVKEMKVQYVLASRVWCEFMEPLAKKASDTVICIGAFQECVLYSKASTTASFVTKENKITSVLEFLKHIDTSKRTVIVCRTDQEVKELEKALLNSKHVVFACDSTMTVQDLYNLRGSWDDYQEPVIGPILLCCDGNLLHMNITNAHYLVHYSLPHLFSMFCKRFSALNDNYASIFKKNNEGVRIKILLEDTNVEQLPKILHFIRRCTTDVPDVLDAISSKVLIEKDESKAMKLVPICDNLMALGECPDFWNCQERHAIFKDYDEPKDSVPTDGIITFKILHYHTAALYSARLLTNVSNGKTVKYPQNYNMLSMKISMYYTRESNRQLHGIPKVGDICAVSVRQNFFVRCQVVKILSLYQKGNPNYVLVKLIDEEKLEKSRDIYLYYLPDELKQPETHVVHVRLANIQPKDKDITFSELAKQQLKKITDGDDELYLSGRIATTIGNCVIVESLETCRDLTSVKKTVIRHDFKQELLEKHAILNPEHLLKLNKLCAKGGLVIRKEPEPVKIVKKMIKLPKEQWAHLDKADMSAILFASAENPSDFFVRLVKFENACNVLVKDIQKYVAQNPQKVTDICEGDIVLAKLPDDSMFERARVDEIIDDNKVKCFFVDQGDWREVSKDDLVTITEKFITQLPFQAIECRLIGVKPAGQNWTEFATNWFINCFEDKSGDLKQLYVKYFTKEKPQHTGGHKYGVAIIDTNSDQDVLINDLIMEHNLGQEEESEVEYLNQLDFKNTAAVSKDIDNEDDTWEKVSKSSSMVEDSPPKISLADIFPKKPIRSVPLVASDESDTSDEKWNINMAEDFMDLFRPALQSNRPNAKEFIQANLPAIKPEESPISSIVSSSSNKDQKSSDSVSDTESCVRIQSAMSDMQIIPTPKIKELDSDDLTSPEPTQISAPSVIKPDVATHTDSVSKPKLLWRQNKNNVIVKIQLIGIEDYELIITERSLKFAATVNDTEYGFDLELYGVIDNKKSTHTNKGQYVLMNLVKILNRNWLTLTKSGGIQKWIVYDIDSIDVSSDEEEIDKTPVEVIRNMCNNNDSESDDDEFFDDINFSYS